MNKNEKNIQEFANQHKLIFEDEGECGFGRECVGLIDKRGSWVDYNPCSHPNYEPIEELNDERLDDITPADAYHKHDCVAVLGRGDEAIKQLSEWVDELKKLNVELVEYKTGADGIQALMSGVIGYAFKIPNGN